MSPIFIEQFFAFDHLPPHLREVSRQFALLALYMLLEIPCNQELSVALRKLLESKDAAVRAKLASDPSRSIEDVCGASKAAPEPTEVP